MMVAAWGSMVPTARMLAKVKPLLTPTFDLRALHHL
jgi:hypothetical protein